MKNIYKHLLIPLIVGGVIALVQFGLPYFFSDKKELTYNILDPITYFDKNVVGELEIIIDGKKSTALFSNQFFIENTGQIPLKNVPVRINFETQDSLFQIYKYLIETQPPYEFGDIETSAGKHNVSLDIELLNPKDKISINILTNTKVLAELYSKSEGMTLNRAQIDEPKNEWGFSYILALIASILSTVLSFIISPKTRSSLGDVANIIDKLFTTKQQNGLKIISALYGMNDTYIDVTEQLNQMVVDNKLEVKVLNDIAGDPLVGIKKELKVIYSIGSDIETIVVNEKQTLEIPLKNTP